MEIDVDNTSSEACVQVKPRHARHNELKSSASDHGMANGRATGEDNIATEMFKSFPS